jgi:hypothetical protein
MSVEIASFQLESDGLSTPIDGSPTPHRRGLDAASTAAPGERGHHNAAPSSTR